MRARLGAEDRYDWKWDEEGPLLRQRPEIGHRGAVVAIKTTAARSCVERSSRARAMSFDGGDKESGVRCIRAVMERGVMMFGWLPRMRLLNRPTAPMRHANQIARKEIIIPLRNDNSNHIH